MKLGLQPQMPAEHGGKSQLPIDLSASLNPLGPSPAAMLAARESDLTKYPEATAASLARTAAARHGVEPEAVVPVAGASAGLWLAAIALARPGDRCLALGPCFGEYERCARLAGSSYTEARCPSEDQTWSGASAAAALSGEPELCLLGNPSNPAGTALSSDIVRELCAGHPATMFVVDEAFAAFAPDGISLVEGELPPGNAVVVRSLTKELGLPGLRMGYLIAGPELAAALRGLLPTWPLSAPAIAAAVAGLGDVEHVHAGRRVGQVHVHRLMGALQRTGARVFPTAVNYVLCRAPGLATRLEPGGIAVRDCSSFGLPDHFRLAAPTPPDLDAVLSAIDG